MFFFKSLLFYHPSLCGELSCPSVSCLYPLVISIYKVFPLFGEHSLNEKLNECIDESRDTLLIQLGNFMEIQINK